MTESLRIMFLKLSFWMCTLKFTNLLMKFQITGPLYCTGSLPTLCFTLWISNCNPQLRDGSSMLRHGSLLGKTPAKFKPFSHWNNAVSCRGRPKVNINRDFQSLNRLRYFYGGHVSNDVIVLTIVKGIYAN